MIDKFLSKKAFYKVFLLFIPLLFGGGHVFSQDVYVYLEAIDNFSGKELKAEFRVQSQGSGRSYTLKDEDGKKYFELKKGDQVSIKVFLDGFYPEDKMLAYNDLSGDEERVLFKLEKRPIARLNLSAIESERKRKQPAQFEVFLGNKLIGKGNTTQNNAVYSLTVTEGGQYDILVSGEGYEPQKYTQQVEVSTPENVIARELELSKASSEILVTLTDEQYGKPVAANIVVKEKKSGKVSYQGTPANGMFKMTFESGLDYHLVSTAKGFKDFEKDISGPQTQNVNFKMRPVTMVEFEILNAQNKKEIGGMVQLESPSGKKIELNGEKTFLPEEKGNYKVEVSSSGFMPKNGTIMVNNFNGGVMNFTFELEEADQQYKIKVIDHYSRELIENVNFKVFSQAGIQLPGIKADKNNSWNFMTDNKAKYFIEASAEGYSDFTQNLKDEKVFEVELYWRPELTYSINLRDELSKEVVDNADLNILNAKGKSIFVFKAKEKGKFLARMYKNESYSYLIKSSAYEENIASLVNYGENVQDLLLKKKGTNELKLVFVDFISKEIIKPDYRIGLNGKPITVKDDIVLIEQNGSYSLRALLKNYQALKVDNLEQSASAKTLTLEMKRETYPIKVFVKKMNKESDFDDLKLTMEFGNNNAVRSVLIPAGLYFESFVQAETKYRVKVQKEGFEPLTREFDLFELSQKNAKDLKLELELVEFKKIEAIVTKPEAPKVEPAPIPVKVNEPTPPVEKEVLAKIPERQEDLTKELTDKASIGKRYFLDQVNFDQASPVITDKIVDQLNKIATTLKAKPEVKIEIVGHTDNVGDPRANLGLSRFRAKAVSNYLFNAGADPARIIVIGKGETEPIAPNDTEENKAKNRRVEMILIEN